MCVMSKKFILQRSLQRMGDHCGNDECVQPAANPPSVTNLKSYSSRLETFGNWPKYFHTKPEALAHSGFVYSGSSDTVQCFKCGGILKDWKEGKFQYFITLF